MRENKPNQTSRQNKSKLKKWLGLLLLLFFVAFITWRFIRPMNIFKVEDRFALPIRVEIPEGLDSVSAEECGGCHEEIYKEWSESMHAKAWTDPYFQVDFVYDDSKQICLNCHTPLENQQENIVLGFNDKGRVDPILEPNPKFDPKLRDEGMTCAVCHVRNGRIKGPFETDDAPHPVTVDPEMTSGMKVCMRCHVLSGHSWDTFYRISPCGTVAEIEEGGRIPDCIGCHMPEIVRPLVQGMKERKGRRHLFWGGHVPEQVIKALEVKYEKTSGGDKSSIKYEFTLTNIGTTHNLPTGTPDRFLSLELRLLDNKGRVIKEKTYLMKRYILWRPFIVDLKDTRLAYKVPRKYTFAFKSGGDNPPSMLDVTVRYHLLAEKRRKKIGYENKEPIAYPIYKKSIKVR